MSRRLQLVFSDGYSNTITLDKSEGFHRVRNIWIAIIDQPRFSKPLGCHCPKCATRAQNLNAVVEPIDMNGRVSCLVRPVHHCIADDLVQCRHGIQPCSLFNVARCNIYRDAIVGRQFFLELAQELRNGTAYLLGIDYFFCVFVAINSEELYICAV